MGLLQRIERLEVTLGATHCTCGGFFAVVHTDEEAAQADARFNACGVTHHRLVVRINHFTDNWKDYPPRRPRASS